MTSGVSISLMMQMMMMMVSFHVYIFFTGVHGTTYIIGIISCISAIISTKQTAVKHHQQVFGPSSARRPI
jgi:hypothetical protein